MPFPVVSVDEVLAAMITPAVLISASGTLALSTTNRLGRVVDRVRALAADAEALKHPDGLEPDEIEDRRDLISGQLVRLVQRIRLLQTALTAVYVALGLFIASSLTIGLRSATNLVPHGVPAVLGLAGAAALLTASVLLVREARVAVGSTLLEMAHVRGVVARRTGRPVPDE